MPFVIFGPTEHFKWILQVAAYLKEFLNLVCFRQTMWRYLIGGYRLGRIKLLSRWIL
jgi:hypothetical protein